MISAGLKWLIAVCLGIPLVLIGVSAWVSYDALVATRSTAQAVAHTYDVREKLREIMVNLEAAETGERGFLLTRQKLFLEPYAGMTPQISGQLAELQPLVAPKAIQRANAAQLQALIGDWLNHIRQCIALEESGRHDEALALVNTGYGRIKMDGIRRVVADMNRVEDGQLTEREAAFSQQLARTNAIGAGIVGVQLLLTAGVGFLLWWFARVRSYATVCAWSKTIQYEGKWITFENYLAQRFGLRITHGINPTEAQKIMDLVLGYTSPTGPTHG